MKIDGDLGNVQSSWAPVTFTSPRSNAITSGAVVRYTRNGLRLLILSLICKPTDGSVPSQRAVCLTAVAGKGLL